jgi:dUTP pyrophosphatase
MKYIKIREVKSPSRGTPQSAGIDFYIPDDWNEGESYDLGPGERVLIPSGIKLKVPEGHALIAFNKSGVATKTGVIVGACVVDEDYQGEIHLSIINTNHPKEYWNNGHYATYPGYVSIEPGTKIMQFIIVPVNYSNPIEVESIEELFPEQTERGEGGFGSTGIK